ncbi:MAG: sn-glycerol-3-phosphate ABC transporter substrate-binding protein UgpB [Alphaproteobacteria bacterium]|nr:sn-glycerol-3-phosphate ABC transporter substrate-binding protein UgpB [Alphaproteobacteria bacterium]MBU0798322.1 sn-glycerol-3-phosphate ABC transporter substrate-binding protein UgpB [Alphaproteobacteria bacterium]MBU0887423.1 sn-glycerol-3-phosphate ABC transporter substrate-binding protein UgpB [Alphaproteobacteria bacterium]MBU1813368.1 sn-glycerol-3-phosphate ABC transporter substrate-binding protein UgpB [Alphaproteobacteria bacterium]MBU2089053.1 sn-glycerol-3-phosphate ABC transpor
MMLRKTALAAGVFAAALTGASAAYAQTEIQWWHAMGGRLGEILQGQVDQFNASQKDYKVVATNKGNYSETLNAGVAAFRAKQQPHLLQVYEVGTASMMAAKGAIKPVYEVMNEGGFPFDPKNYLSAVTGYYSTLDGKMLSFPYNSSTPVMYVNKDLFKKAGIDTMTLPKTWEQVGAALDKLKAAGVECPMTVSWQSWTQLENLSAYHNQPFATKSNGMEGMDAQLTFNGPVQVKHIANLGKWAKEGKFIYGGRRNEAAARFRSGECGMMFESSAGYAGVKKEAKFEFAISNLPYYADVEGAPFNTIIGGASVWVMQGHSKEAYKGVAQFLNFLAKPEMQAYWHQNTGYLPITPAAYELTKKEGFYDKNPGTDIAIIQMTGKAPTNNSKGLRLGSFDQIRTIIDEELEGVWSGEKTAKVALDNAVARGNELLRRFERANK